MVSPIKRIAAVSEKTRQEIAAQVRENKAHHVNETKVGKSMLNKVRAYGDACEACITEMSIGTPKSLAAAQKDREAAYRVLVWAIAKRLRRDSAQGSK